MAMNISLFSFRQAFAACGAVFVAATLSLGVVSPADAQRRNNDNERNEENRTLSTSVGETVQEAVECGDVEDFSCVVSVLTPLLSDDLTPYERSLVLQLRGNAYFNLDNLAAATRDLLGSVNSGALTQDEENSLRINVAQLYMAQEQIDNGIEQFEIAIRNGQTLNTRLAKMLATAYVQAERYREGLPYAEQFYREETNKSLNDYNLMQFYYNQLDRPSDELRVIREGLSAFPGERRSWQNLVSIFARLGRDSDAFEANKLMYLNGLFEECNELFRLAQYYSAFDNPYRGATILEREINAGRCEGNQEQLERLANMWRQAAEFDRAAPVIERIATATGDSEWWLRLAEAYYQLNEYQDAERAFVEALNRGGLDDAGTAWVLLGDTRLKLGDRQGALQAFRQGRNFSGSRRRADGFIRFVQGQIDGEIRRRLQIEQVLIDECRLFLEAEARSRFITGEVSEDGRVVFAEESIPERCRPYFDRFGEQIREVGMTDEEAAAALAEREAAREAAGIAG